MNNSYKEEKKKLLKRLFIFWSLTVIASFAVNILDGNNSFFLRLLTGTTIGGLAYIPMLLYNHLQLRRLMAFVIAAIYIFLISFLVAMLGYIYNHVAFVLLIIMIIDMGYSSHKIFKMHKNETNEE